ncbi:peptidase M23-like protein [Hydrogenoanaerobacterium saccharovorans]|uniref:Peptidase family M23 n=1 Tax=Hydrogenoanaerobacterium saccharovorans TaxID=474960 RepID=A0A1H8E5H0_9FIRM|nr:peptidoglycan DD-metalloendopeptidase family protein [Hydrogenoanaerobacterium saccharovorans]RPF42118.1 peptidase M23-like protein [Hydrogenoanaerobacterium saccharovorans]SEN14038.1 Peptidase family M23 [Hydrogenoanaerobacterium saccharovorans]
MAKPILGNTYRFNNVGAPSRRLNLYSSGSASNGMNVVLYTEDNTNEQQWVYRNNRLLINTNTSFCLDRYNLSGNANHNNADIWAVSSSEDDNQKIVFEDNGNYVKIKLASTSLYLTAYSNANGTSSGKTKTSAGNVYWAASSSSNYQRWTFTGITPPSGNYRWPTESKKINQKYGNTHDGVDIAPKALGVEGDKIFAYMDGVVSMKNTSISTNPNEGYTVRIHHNNPVRNGYSQLRTQYMHLKQPALVNVGDSVYAGQLIGYMGNTGNSTGVHLHFETRVSNSEFPLGGTSVYKAGNLVDPSAYLNLT